MYHIMVSVGTKYGIHVIYILQFAVVYQLYATALGF